MGAVPLLVPWVPPGWQHFAGRGTAILAQLAADDERTAQVAAAVAAGSFEQALHVLGTPLPPPAAAATMTAAATVRIVLSADAYADALVSGRPRPIHSDPQWGWADVTLHDVASVALHPSPGAQLAAQASSAPPARAPLPPPLPPARVALPTSPPVAQVTARPPASKGHPGIIDHLPWEPAGGAPSAPSTAPPPAATFHPASRAPASAMPPPVPPPPLPTAGGWVPAPPPVPVSRYTPYAAPLPPGTAAEPAVPESVPASVAEVDPMVEPPARPELSAHSTAGLEPDLIPGPAPERVPDPEPRPLPVPQPDPVPAPTRLSAPLPTSLPPALPTPQPAVPPAVPPDPESNPEPERALPTTRVPTPTEVIPAIVEAPAYVAMGLDDPEAFDATVDRSALLAAAGAAAPFSGVSVLAVLCPAGHVSPPHASTCRTCGRDVPHQEPFSTPRPPLGVLRLSTGDVVKLDRGVLLGRAPHVDPTLPIAQRPHVVRVASPLRDVSRTHLEVILEGWHVLVRDLATTNGTTVTLPGREPMRLVAHDQQVIEPGTVVSMADEVSLTFEIAD